MNIIKLNSGTRIYKAENRSQSRDNNSKWYAFTEEDAKSYEGSIAVYETVKDLQMIPKRPESKCKPKPQQGAGIIKDPDTQPVKDPWNRIATDPWEGEDMDEHLKKLMESIDPFGREQLELYKRQEL